MENNNPNQTNNQQPDNTPSIYPTPTETPIENIQPIASQLNPQAVPAYNQTPAPQQPDNTPQQNSAGTVVLQWLTYAFWGWTILGMSSLTALVLTSFMVPNSNSNLGDISIYALGATLVLLPISFICDFYYRKIEPQKKTGASSIVMVIHAVIFGIFGVGSLISLVVITLMTLLSNSQTKTGYLIAIYTLLIITFYYAAMFLRTINIPKFPNYHKFFMIFMPLTVGIIALLGIIGPISKGFAAKNDSLIDANIFSVSSDINSYYSKNKSLPTSLNEITTTGGSGEKLLISKNILTYTPGSNKQYKICTTYKFQGISGISSPYSTYISSQNNYTITANYHPAGYYCYNASVYSSSYSY